MSQAPHVSHITQGKNKVGKKGPVASDSETSTWQVRNVCELSDIDSSMGVEWKEHFPKAEEDAISAIHAVYLE